MGVGGVVVGPTGEGGEGRERKYEGRGDKREEEESGSHMPCGHHVTT